MKFYILFSILLFAGTCYGRQRKGEVNEEPKNQQDLKKRDRDGKCTYYLTYRKSLIRSRPCTISNPKFPRIVLEVFQKTIISRAFFFISTSP